MLDFVKTERTGSGRVVKSWFMLPEDVKDAFVVE